MALAAIAPGQTGQPVSFNTGRCARIPVAHVDPPVCFNRVRAFSRGRFLHETPTLQPAHHAWFD
eukprot:7762131-Alexandrium_andersonii.AAC.1